MSNCKKCKAPFSPDVCPPQDRLCYKCSPYGLNFEKIKPMKCKHCNYIQEHHKANTLQCPFGSKKYSRCWPTSYLDSVFEPKYN